MKVKWEYILLSIIWIVAAVFTIIGLIGAAATIWNLIMIFIFGMNAGIYLIIALI